MKFFAIFLLCFVSCMGEVARFDNYRVYQIVIETEEQLVVLKKIQFGWDGVQFFRTPYRVGAVIEIIVPPHKFADIADLFKAYKIKNILFTKNVQR